MNSSASFSNRSCECCLPVAFGGLHDRSLHQQMPGEGEHLGVAEPGFFGQCAHNRPDVREVSGAGVANRVFAVAGLEERDRALARHLVFGTVQRARTLDHAIEGLGKRRVEKLDPPVRTALRRR